jgi:hypothetical protein
MLTLQYTAEILSEVDGVISVELEGEAPERLRVEFASATQYTDVSNALEYLWNLKVHQSGPTLFVYEEE